MKKILIERDIYKVLRERDSFLDRADVKVFTAASNDEMLHLHRAESMDLIISDLEMRGISISTEQLCAQIRKDPDLRNVSIIMVCACDRTEMERSMHFGANAVILKPIKPPLLLAKAKQLLDINWRETYRVQLSVSVAGNNGDAPYFYRSLDITTTGILMETNQTFHNGGRVFCSFVLSDTTSVRTIGEVVRTIKQQSAAETKRYGIHFVDLSPKAKKAIENYLDAKALQSRRALY